MHSSFAPAPGLSIPGFRFHSKFGCCNSVKRLSKSLGGLRRYGGLVMVSCRVLANDGSDEGKDDGFYMRRCVEMARKAIGCTRPNPMVCCVIVKDGKIVGEGFHPKAGQPHAEEYDAIIVSSSLIHKFLVPTSQEPGANQPLCVITAASRSSPMKIRSVEEEAASKMIIFTDKETTVEPVTAQKGIETVVLDGICLNEILEYGKRRGLCSILLDLRGGFDELQGLLNDGIEQNMLQKVIVEVLPLWDENSTKSSFVALKSVQKRLKKEFLLQKLEKYEKSFQEKIDKLVEAIQVVKENVAVFNNEDPLLENSSEEQDVFDETSNKKDKSIEMEQDQDFVFDLSGAIEEYEEEKDKDGDDRKLELTMGNAEVKPEILAAQTFGDVPENKKDKKATKNVVTVSKWQNFRSQDESHHMVESLIQWRCSMKGQWQSRHLYQIRKFRFNMEGFNEGISVAEPNVWMNVASEKNDYSGKEVPERLCRKQALQVDNDGEQMEAPRPE
ncbi:hypothetical protein GH714_013429 [Hevea brasiliensis]|uniref:CMP/dCMP-type deaminase domain-containing protein n=1 Tax=Hevea brasiliensis TaxID=3981 RepID=A0A6A6LA10_HEVBR|nr:hypothetical protein GH714_013429 [Hevea brasiliensis]